MSSAHDAAANSQPFLPFHGSVLPALLALRKTHQTTLQSKAHEAYQKKSLEEVRWRLEFERINLKDQKALQEALESRTETLRSHLETSQGKSPEQAAQERIEGLRKAKKEYDSETSKLLKSLNEFIDGHLGPMLAAEELGGPVVGDLMDIDPDELKAGFNAQGKLRKAKASNDEDSRQRRIDDLWGAADNQTASSNKRGNARDRDEASAAGLEMRELTELLLNHLMESAGGSAATYIKIPRETAAVRFLVRSKVAQFHPKDATRLRLVDFARDLDD